MVSLYINHFYYAGYSSVILKAIAYAECTNIGRSRALKMATLTPRIVK